jgi:hypothetical protein
LTRGTSCSRKREETNRRIAMISFVNYTTISCSFSFFFYIVNLDPEEDRIKSQKIL